MEKNEKHIFVSHQHEDAPKIRDLIKLIERGGENTIKDSSNYEDKKENNAKSPEYIESLIRPAIDWAGTVIVLIGDETKDSDWVDWEINYAGRKDKKIIGVFLPGATESDIPKAFKENGTALCGWNSNSINDALNGETPVETPQGTAATKPIGYPIKRFNC